MAGAGYKLFNTGDVLTAAQVNTYLMQQTVMVFASATARTTALNGVLAEGMVSYLQDTNALEVYDGTAWVASAAGDITSVTAGTGLSGGGISGAVTLTNAMATEITAAGDIIVGTGSGTFDNLPIGTTGQVLTADTTVSPYKVKWASASAASGVGCFVYKSGNQAIANSTTTTVTFDSEDFDTNAFHSTTTNTSRITIPSGYAGKYVIVGTARWDGNATSMRNTIIKVNGTTIAEMSLPSTGAAIACQISAVTLKDLAVGDYVEMDVFQLSGVSLNVVGGSRANTSLGVMYYGA